jgi:hypothetical protein
MHYISRKKQRIQVISSSASRLSTAQRAFPKRHLHIRLPTQRETSTCNSRPPQAPTYSTHTSPGFTHRETARNTRLSTCAPSEHGELDPYTAATLQRVLLAPFTCNFGLLGADTSCERLLSSMFYPARFRSIRELYSRHNTPSRQ